MRPRVSKSSSGSMESAGGSQCEIIKEHTEKSTFDDCEFPLFYDSIHKTSDFLWQNKKNNDDGCILITSLNKVTKEKMNLVIKLQMHIYDRRFGQGALEENLLFCSLRKVINVFGDR